MSSTATARCAGLCTASGVVAADRAHRRRLTAVARGLLHDPVPAAVSDARRGVLVRTVLHDRSHADVAVELGVPVGAVESRVHHALRSMRSRIHRPETLASEER